MKRPMQQGKRTLKRTRANQPEISGRRLINYCHRGCVVLLAKQIVAWV